MENARLLYMTKLLEIAYDLAKSSGQIITPAKIKELYVELLSEFNFLNNPDSIPTINITPSTPKEESPLFKGEVEDIIPEITYPTMQAMTIVRPEGMNDSEFSDHVMTEIVNMIKTYSNGVDDTVEAECTIVEPEVNCNCAVCEDKRIKEKQKEITKEDCKGDINDDMEGEDPDDFIDFFDQFDDDDDDDDDD